MMATMIMKQQQQQQQQQKPNLASPLPHPVPTTPTSTPTPRIITNNRILLFLSLSIALVSCSQIVFLTPTIDQNQQWTPKQQQHLNMKNTKKTKKIKLIKGLKSTITSSGSGKEKKGKGNKKTKTHIEEYLNQRAKYQAHVWELHHGVSNNDNNNSDSSNDDSNSNDNDNDGNNSRIFVLPDVEKELEKEVTATAEEPWLVVHIGPPKTATTTIQCGLEKYALRLAMKDHYHFVGGGCGIADQEYLMPNAEETVLRRLVISTLHELEYTYETTPTENDDDDDDENSGESGESSGNSSRASSSSLMQYFSRHHNPEFQHGYHIVKKMLQRMSYLRQRKRSVILSGEQFGSQLSRRKTVMTTFHAMFTDGTTIGGNNKKKNTNKIVNNIIDENTGDIVTAGFPLSKIRIVLAYRHFVDWLPSYYYQNELVLNNQMDTNWIVHGPHSEVVLSSIENQQNNHTTTKTRHRHVKYQKLTDTQLSSIETQRHQRLIKKSRVQSFLDYTDEYLSNWELHATDIIQWMDTIKQQQRQQQTDNGTSTNSTSSGTNSTKQQQQRRSAKQHQQHMLEMLPKDRHAIHPSWWLYTVWSSHFTLKNQVQVYDMHSPMNMKTPNEDMFTDFICHMIPSAHATCQTLVSSLEENKKKKKAGGGTQEDTEKEETEFNYEEPSLHSSYSFLHPNRESKKMGFTTASSSNSNNSTTTTDENENNNNNADTPQSMIIRPSSNHHATRIVEELLVRGVIQEFTYNENNKEEEKEIQNYFQEEIAYSDYYYGYELELENNENNPPPPKPFFIGLTKPKLVEITNILLEQHGILVSSSTSSSINSTTASSEPSYSEKYFDCMSPQLEQRLLNASWTFMDLMYRHTPMLAIATAATFPEAEELSSSSSSAAHLKLIQQEKQKRWKQAKLDHARLFQKNKQKGKYCDINLDKVLQHNPHVEAALSALQYKPSYLRLTWHELPPHMQQHAILLGYTAPQLWNKGVSPLMTTPWKDLAWQYKVAAFQLGWEMERWDGLKMK